MLEGIHWLGHASFRIGADNMTVYIDPWKLTAPVPADLVLVTHAHSDHLSPGDISKVACEDTVIVCPESCASKLAGDIRVIAPGDSLVVPGARVEVVYAYNTNKPNHPRGAGFVGYILEVGGRRIYHAGDTDLIPEMDDVPCDVALLPIGGTYTMNAAEAARAAQRIKPGYVVPMHWGDIVGTMQDVATIERGLPEGVELVVLEAER